MSPRVVIGAPVYEKARWLPKALESLLAQTYADFAIVLLDDQSADETLEVAHHYAQRDPRIHVHVNERRLGMLENTRLAVTLSRELFPQADFWALGSDHDIWEPGWLEALVHVLDDHPAAVLAYPLTRRIDEHGVDFSRQKAPWRFSTEGETDPLRRLRHAVRGMAAGDMIYGLFRATALDWVGVYRPVLIPDRLLLSELALCGEFVQVEQILWRRRFRGLADLERQRRAFWPGGPPAYARLPWWSQHTALLAWDYGVRDKGNQLGIGQLAGARVVASYAQAALRHRAWRRWRRVRGRVIHARDLLLGPPVKAALRHPSIRRAVRERLVPALAEVESALERHTEDASEARR